MQLDIRCGASFLAAAVIGTLPGRLAARLMPVVQASPATRPACGWSIQRRLDLRSLHNAKKPSVGRRPVADLRLLALRATYFAFHGSDRSSDMLSSSVQGSSVQPPCELERMVPSTALRRFATRKRTLFSPLVVAPCAAVVAAFLISLICPGLREFGHGSMWAKLPASSNSIRPLKISEDHGQ